MQMLRIFYYKFYACVNCRFWLYINESVYLVIAQDTKIMSIIVCSTVLLSSAMPKGDECE